MRKINITKVPIETYDSPKGRFAQRYQGISLALGGKRHPFDLELVTLPAGKANSPYHYHTAQWELYAIVRGAGQVRTPKGRTAFRAGDVFMCPPGEPHQIINNSKRDLQYYCIADNPISDSCYYPDSKKWLVDHRIIKGKRVPYLTGEE
jgi:uncharacterized cupin superfamily protein